MLRLSIQRVRKLNIMRPQISALGRSHFSTSVESSSSKSNPPRVPNLIGGSFVDSKSSTVIDVINPATQEVVSQVPLSTDEEFKAAVSAAKKAYPSWRDTPITTRQRVMLKLQELIRRDMDKLALNVTTEQGKTLKDAQAKTQVQCLLRRVFRGSRSFGVSAEVNASSSSSQRIMDKEYEHSAHNYHPLPIVFSKAKGTSVWDPEGNKYLDFLAGYSAVNQGHCHPKILKALQEQAERLTVSSRAFYNDRFPLFAEYVTTLFGYDMVLPMNTGAEGVETAMKLARKWGYEKKRIPKDEAIIVSCCGCFNGRTLGVISMSCDNEAIRGFGPLLPGHLKVDFGDADALERIFKEKGERIAAFILEPIQGEAGVIIPPDGYLKAVRDLCSKYNILMIADEIQTGLGRTGKMLACEWEEVRPDVVVLGKALGGGVIPVSAVLADKDVMLCIQPGQHGSTFGGNPLASAVAIASLEVIKNEKLVERSVQMGEKLIGQLLEIQEQYPDYVKEVRGRGLFIGVELNRKKLFPVSVYELSTKLKERAVLAKPTHDTIIRFTPPLCISEDEIKQGSKAWADVLGIDLPKLQKAKPIETAPVSDSACDRCGRVMYD